jgi:putative endonuclease
MSWHVYLIECRGGALYTGIAVDVQARYAAHAAGRGARYTRANPPLRLLASFACEDRSAASLAEAAIRRLDAAGKRRLAAAAGAGGTLAEAMILAAAARAATAA